MKINLPRAAFLFMRQTGGILISDRGVEQLVARRAHNPKVEGSNPSPATRKKKVFSETGVLFLFSGIMYTVYVLYSEKYDKHYTGYSSDFSQRILSHNVLGKKGWSIRFRPWKVILQEEYETKKEAMEREKWLKTGAGREFVRSLPH